MMWTYESQPAGFAVFDYYVCKNGHRKFIIHDDEYLTRFVVAALNNYTSNYEVLLLQKV